MSQTFILGINDAVDGSSYLSTEAAYNLVGHNVGNLSFSITPCPKYWRDIKTHCLGILIPSNLINSGVSV